MARIRASGTFLVDSTVESGASRAAERQNTTLTSNSVRNPYCMWAHPASLPVVRKRKSGYLVPLQDVGCSFYRLSRKNLFGAVLAGRCSKVQLSRHIVDCHVAARISVFVAVHAGQRQCPEQQGGPLQAGNLLYARRGDLVELRYFEAFLRKALDKNDKKHLRGNSPAVDVWRLHCWVSGLWHGAVSAANGYPLRRRKPYHLALLASTSQDGRYGYLVGKTSVVLSFRRKHLLCAV